MKPASQTLTRLLDRGLFLLTCTVTLAGVTLMAPLSMLAAKVSGLGSMALLILSATFLSAAHRLAMRRQVQAARARRFTLIPCEVALAFKAWMNDLSQPEGDYVLLRNSVNWRRGGHDFPPEPPHRFR